MQTRDLIQEGITSYKSGDRQKAYQFFLQAIKQDPQDELGWLWLSACISDVEKRKYCIQKALEINPNSQQARQALARLEEGSINNKIENKKYPPQKGVKKAPEKRQGKFLWWAIAGIGSMACFAIFLGLGWWYLSKNGSTAFSLSLPGGSTPSEASPNSNPFVSLKSEEITLDNVERIEEMAQFGKSTIDSIAYAPNADLIALGTAKGVYLYTAVDQKEIGILPINDVIDQVALSSDGQWLAASFFEYIQIWRVGDATLKNTIPESANYSMGLAFSPDNVFLATGNQVGIINIWNVSDGTLVKSIQSLGYLSSITYTPDGKSLAVIANDGSVQIWDINSGSQTVTINTEGAEQIVFSPDGQILVSATSEGIELWDINTGMHVTTIAQNYYSWIKDIKFSPDSQILAVSTEEQGIQFWRVVDGVLLNSIMTRANDEISFFSNGQILVSASPTDSVKFWRVNDGTLTAAIEDHLNSESSLAFSPDGKFLASGSDNGGIRLWDLTNGNLIQSMEGHINKINSLIFSEDSQTITSTSYDGLIVKWQVSSSSPISTVQIYGESNISELKLSPNGQIAASTDHANFDPVYLWNANDGSLLKPLGGCETNGDGLAFSPDSQRIAIGTYPLICIWEIQSGSLVTSFENQDGINGILFSPDGNTLAVNSEDGIDLWDIAAGEKITSLDYMDGDGAVFSPNGQIFITASERELWDVENQMEIRILEELGSYIESLAFSPDGRLLAIATDDDLIRLWGVPP